MQKKRQKAKNNESKRQERITDGLIVSLQEQEEVGNRRETQGRERGGNSVERMGMDVKAGA